MKMKLYEQFIKEKRKEWNITRDKMAERLEYGVQYLSKIENGKLNFPLDFVEKIQKTFVLDEEELIKLSFIVSEIQKEWNLKRNTRMSSYKRFMKRKRNDLRINAIEMSRRLGYSYSYFKGIENGRANMPLDFIEKMQNTFDLEEEELKELKLIVYNIQEEIESERNKKLNPFKLFMKKKRKDWNITCKEMAQKLGYDISYFYSIEKNRENIPIDFVKKIQKAFILNERELEELNHIVLTLQKEQGSIRSEMMKSYKIFIKQKRNDWSITSKEMARKLNYGSTYLSNIENNIVGMPLNFMQKLRNTFSFSNDELEELEYIILKIREKQEIERKTKIQTYKRFIEKKRTDWGMTSKQMATMLGCSLSYLYLIENGRRNIPLNFIGKLQEIFSLNEYESQKLKLMVSEFQNQNRDKTR